MATRSMSYDLDGAFALRDAGEIQRLQAPKTRVLRAPGLKPVFAPNEVALREAVPDEELRDAPLSMHDEEALAADVAPGAPVGVVALPVIGQVNLIHAGIFLAAGFALAAMLKK